MEGAGSPMMSFVMDIADRRRPHMCSDSRAHDLRCAPFLTVRSRFPSMEEGLAVGNEILEIAKLRTVDGRVGRLP